MATTTSRRSSRARSKPENYLNDSSVSLTGNKSTLMDDSESDPETESDGDDYENSNPNKTVVTSTAKKARKPKARSTVKKARKTDAANASFASVNSSVNMSVQSAHASNPLLSALYSGTSSTLSLAQDLIEKHNESPNTAQCQLINLLFRSVGGSSACEIDPQEDVLEDINDEDWTEKLTDVVAEMQNADASTTLVAAVESKKRSKASTKFFKTYKEFWRMIATTALTDGSGATASSTSNDFKSSSSTPTAARLDVELVKDLIARITDVASVGQPDIRYAACIAVFEMSQAILLKVKNLSEKLAKTERQLAAVGETTKRGESLKVQVQALTRVIADMEEAVSTTVFNSVFMHRYRDSNENTRAICLDYLSTWMITRPTLFLEDKFLKYFAWMLHDSKAVVRIAALTALNCPFSHLDSNPDDESVDLDLMKNVSVKFLPHISDLCCDVDPNVQPHAIRFLLSLLREGFLDEFEDEELWDQINFRSLDPKATPEMRKIALEFVIEQLEAFDDGEEDDDDNKKTSGKVTKQESEQTAVAKIDALASWAAHAISGSDEKATDERPDNGFKYVKYLVESLRSIDEFAPLATNWKALLKAINDDAVATTADGDTAAVSDVAKQRVLVRMLMTAVKLEVGSLAEGNFLEGTTAAATIAGGKKRSSKDTAAHESLSVNLLSALPALLVKFAGDIPITRQFAQLPRFLLHSVFSMANRKKDFGALLKELSTLFLKSSDDKILNAAAVSLKHMSQGKHSRTSEAKLALQKITEGLIEKVNELAALPLNTAAVVTPKKGRKSGTKEVTRDTEYAFGLALQQLRVLSKKMNIVDFIGQDDVESFVATLLKAGKARVDKCTAQRNDMILNESVNVVCEVQEITSQLVGWMAIPLHETEDKRIDSEEDDKKLQEGEEGDMSDASVGDVDVDDIKSMRDGFIELSKKIFELVADEAMADEESALVEFINDSQEVTMKCVSDLRSLLCKGLKDSSSEGLRSLALTDDGQLTTGMMRFAKKQETTMKDNSDEGDSLFIENCLIPQSRAVLSNWNNVNRREAGSLLANFTGVGQNSTDVVKTLSLAARKFDEVKLLEVHMATLRGAFETYLSSEPEELTKKKPTEAEMAEFSQREVDHEQQYDDIVKLAVRLSKSLGVSELKNKVMKDNMIEFMKEAVRYAFSCPTKKSGKTEKEEDDEDKFGDRVSFLGLMKHYVNWVKKDNAGKSDVAREFDNCESAFKRHLFFDEDNDASKLTYGADFLSQLGVNKRAAPTATISDNDSSDDEAESSMSASRRTGGGGGAGKAAAAAAVLESVMEHDGEDDTTTTKTGTVASASTASSSAGNSEVKGLFDNVGANKRKKTRTQ